MKTRTADELKARREALANVARTQTAFWDALREFESLTECDVDSTHDYTYYESPTDEDVQDVIGAADEYGDE